MSFQTPITIKEAIEKIEENQYLLPAIQREFVWEHTKIEWLFDSIMRNYPISSFLFWQVEGETKKGYRFYKFINEYRETFKIHNKEISTDGLEKFTAILDGQQRLTSIYIGLKGSFAYREYGALKAEDSERTRPTRQLYLNVSNELNNEEDGRIYEFKFLKKDLTKEEIIYDKTKKWFKVGAILNYSDDEEFDNFVEELDNSFARKAIRQLRRTILEKPIINYFLEKEQDLDKALNIFIRINSGGEPLNFSDLIMSIAVANWKDTDARQAIHSLVDNIRDKGFTISKDFILKVFLYLYSKDIKFIVKNFSKDNAKDFETKWYSIRDTILEVFNLMKVFGFTDYSLVSKNAIIPVIYYLYHKDIKKDFSTKTTYQHDREIIKKWLHTVLVKRIFGASADTVLSQIRSSFTDDFKAIKIKADIAIFPEKLIYSNLKQDTSVSDDFIEELLRTQKDNKYAFSLLALLYPNLDYKNNNFHKDHLHPAAKYEDLSNINKTKYGWETYNSLKNLQMLDANENMSKNDEDLKSWVNKETLLKDKPSFLINHHIPDVGLELENFDEFISERTKILTKELKTLLA